MKLKSTALIPALVITALAACTGTAFGQTEILTFDNLSGPYNSVPNGYGGLQWQNFDYEGGLYATPNSGYVNGVVSPGNIAFNDAGNPAFINGGSFNLNSAYLTGAWNNGLQVEVRGWVGAALTYDNTYTVNASGPTLVNFNYTGIDQVEFISSGGTAYPPAAIGGAGEQFVMDNLSVTLTPEPSTFALAGLAAVSLMSRRLNRPDSGS